MYNKPHGRFILTNSMDGLRDHLARYKDKILSADRSHMSVNDMWVGFYVRGNHGYS